MPSRFSHDLIDRMNAGQDRLIARRLRRDRRILRMARTNLRRWIARDGKDIRPAFVEWRRILDCLSADEIADFLLSDTPLARRLRQSSPFASLLGEAPSRAPRKKHETARA
jgi:hypothetical protein